MNLRPSFLVMAFLACGGKTDGGQSDAGNDREPCGCITAACPASVPAQGSSCYVEGVECEFGSNSRFTCNTVATCSGGSWSLQEPDECPSNSPQCPASVELQQEMTCPSRGTACDYSNASGTDLCVCGVGGIAILDAGVTWACTVPSTGCPNVRPRLGSECTPGGPTCDYSVCGLPSGLSVLCDPTTLRWTEGVQAECL